jgi:DNA-binding MarR family transcriptional regulator
MDASDSAGPEAADASCWRAPRRLDDLLLYRLARLHAVAGSMVVRLCEGGHGITRREWRLVALLAEAGAMPSSRLAERIQLDRARTSRAVSSLVEKRLLERVPGGGDRRFAALRLTEAGHALHAALFPQVAAINGALAGALSDAEARQLDGLLARLADRAQALSDRAELPRAGRGRRSRAPGP